MRSTARDRMMLLATREEGFTLIEVLVTIALALVVFGATLAAFNVFQHDEVYARQRNETQDAARNAINRLTHQLRSVIAPSSKYPGALEEAEQYSIRFETVDTSNTTFGEENKSHAMRVRYCLDDSNPSKEILREYAQEWENKDPGAPSTTACNGTLSGGWTSTRQLVEHVTNEIGKPEPERPVFTYSSSELPQIITVTSDLYLDVNPGHRPGESRLTSAVSLRNANRKPVVKFTITPEAGSNKYRLNASESYDPGGLALTYKWWEKEAENSEVELPTTSQISQVTLSTKKTAYTFKLRVTNPGELSETTTETVTTP
jgi:prepilin-type N-terminal cleavage/methylation domain-containing protein